ncbi:hypothetical protein ACFOG5_01315 [Pedobacter fastidiosus]
MVYGVGVVLASPQNNQSKINGKAITNYSNQAICQKQPYGIS